VGARSRLDDVRAPAVRVRLADLDAVTLDANGTLVGLVDPVPQVVALLGEGGCHRTPAEVRAAMAAEFAYYRAHLVEGRDADSLRRLHERCAAVFLEDVGAALDPSAFAPGYVAALRFEPLPGVRPALAALRARGLELAVVSNWDCSLHERLDELGLAPLLRVVVTAAEAGVGKPDAQPFALALARLGVDPGRTLHVGDGESDRLGAEAAGVHFAPAPLAAAVRALR
jgi:HAD superfamily hydrolase (TIGR01509 family)